MSGNAVQRYWRDVLTNDEGMHILRMEDGKPDAYVETTLDERGDFRETGRGRIIDES